MEDAPHATAAAAAAAPAAPTVPLVHVYTQNLLPSLPAGTHPCAGALPTCERLAAPDLDTVFVATDNHLSLLQPIAPANPVLRLGRQGPFASDFIPLTSRITSLPGHVARSEIQSVAARHSGDASTQHYLAGSVDSYGTAVISHLHVPSSGVDGDAGSSASASPYRSLSSSTILRPSRIVEDGWHGLALHPTDDESACVASWSGKSLSIYSGERLVQTLYTTFNPASCKFMTTAQSHAPLLLCNEGNALSVWDLRTSNGVGQCDNISRGAVQRLVDTPGLLYALDCYTGPGGFGGLVATGGSDKQVSVYDVRKWSIAGRWKNVLKYELMWMQFSAASAGSLLYVAGMDHEVYAGSWANQSLNQRNLERAAFRGDARWVGLARTEANIGSRGGDHIVGMTSSAQLYVLRNAHLQNGPTQAQSAGASAAETAVHRGAGSSSAAADATRARREEVTAARKERVAAGLSAVTPEEQAKRAKINEAKKERKAAATAAAAGKKRKVEELEEGSNKAAATEPASGTGTQS